MSMGFCLDCHRAPRAARPREGGRVQPGLGDDRRLAGDRGGAQVRARLEDQTPAELLRLPSMKRKIEHPAAVRARRKRARATGEAWTSSPRRPGFREAMAREFPEGASEHGRRRPQAVHEDHGGLVRARRAWGLPGCRRPEEHILPFGKSVEGAVPGLPVYYATAMPMRSWAIPLLAETHQGRPTKLEGNPVYAPHGGASSLLAQASMLDLYDPDRATAHTRDGEAVDAGAVKDLLVRDRPRPTWRGRAQGLRSSPTRPPRRRARGSSGRSSARLPEGRLGRVRARGRRAPRRGGPQPLRAGREAHLPVREGEADRLDRLRLPAGRGRQPLLRQGLRQGPPGGEEGRHDEPPVHGGERPHDHRHHGGPPAAGSPRATWSPSPRRSPRR